MTVDEHAPGAGDADGEGAVDGDADADNDGGGVGVGAAAGTSRGAVALGNADDFCLDNLTQVILCIRQSVAKTEVEASRGKCA